MWTKLNDEYISSKERIKNFGYWLLAFGHSLLVNSYKPLAIDHSLLNNSFWLSAFSTKWQIQRTQQTIGWRNTISHSVLRTHSLCLFRLRRIRQAGPPERTVWYGRAAPPLSWATLYTYLYFFNNNEGFRECIKKIFAQKKGRFRLKAVKIIESPGWKALPEHTGNKRMLSPTSANWMSRLESKILSPTLWNWISRLESSSQHKSTMVRMSRLESSSQHKSTMVRMSRLKAGLYM